jgi:hypothetical protein
MTRVAELMKGERFTPETAFHMETTLGLPHGFFDQPNPALADEIIARLKSPLDFVQIDEGFDAKSEAPEPAPARTADQQPVPEDSLSEEAQMPKKVAGGSPRAIKNRRSEIPEQPEPRAPRKASRSKDKPSPGTPQQQPLALSERAEVENIRRANLHLLTRRNGWKVRLGVVMEMSGFNIADRLHGKKRGQCRNKPVHGATRIASRLVGQSADGSRDSGVSVAYACACSARSRICSTT